MSRGRVAGLQRENSASVPKGALRPGRLSRLEVDVPGSHRLYIYPNFGEPIMKTNIYSDEDVPSLTVRHIASANLGASLLSVSKEVKLEVAVTKMLMHDFSQLPVVNGKHKIAGAITWKGVARLLTQGIQGALVKSCITKAPEISINASLLDALGELSNHEFLLVLDEQRLLTGIITHADITEDFSKLGEPFLLLGEIEKSLRKLILPVFDRAKHLIVIERMESIDISSPADFTLGNFLQALSDTKLWEALQLPLLDRRSFIEELDEINKLRNCIMHFRAPFLERPLVKRIRRFRCFLNYLVDGREADVEYSAPA